MDEKHFKIRTDLTLNLAGKILYRIEATKDNKYARKGTVGGYVEKYSNLQQLAWVGDNSMVSGNAVVDSNAAVIENSSVGGNAKVLDTAIIRGSSSVYQNAVVSGNANICDNSHIYGNATITDKVRIYGRSYICENAKISGDVVIYSSNLFGKMKVEKQSDVIFLRDSVGQIVVSLNGIIVSKDYYESLKDFKKKFKFFGVERGYTDIEIKHLTSIVDKTYKLIQCF